MNSNIPTKIILLVITSGLFFPLAISAQTSNPHTWTGDDPVVIPTTNPHSAWDEDDTPSGGDFDSTQANTESGGGSGGANIPDSGQVSFLTNLPFIGEPDNFSDLINALFIMTLVLGALLAVVKLTIAGATYMLDGSVTKKQDALASIKGAILGLLLILSTTLILTQINPDITDMDALQNTLTITVPDDDEDEDEDSFLEACEDLGAGEDCSVVDCELFDSPSAGEWLGWVGTTIGYAIQITGIDYGLNATSCSARCSWIGGDIIDDSFGESGSCVYPNDPEVAHKNLIDLETNTIFNSMEENGMEEFDEIQNDDTAQVCIQGNGRTACQAEREECTSGRMSPNGERGVPRYTRLNVPDIGAVVICSYN